MGKIGLTGGFTPLPEGEYTFMIKSADQTKLDDFGKLDIVLVTKEGKTHTEKYNFLKSTGERNDTAYNAFSSLARAALDLPQSDDRAVDPDELVGHYIQCEIVHSPGNNGNVFANLGWKKTHMEGFDGQPAEQATTATAVNAPKANSGDNHAPTKPFDLDSLLG